MIQRRIKRHFYGVHDIRLILPSYSYPQFFNSFMFYCYLRFMIADSSFESNAIYFFSPFIMLMFFLHCGTQSVRNNLCTDHRSFFSRFEISSLFCFCFAAFYDRNDRDNRS